MSAGTKIDYKQRVLHLVQFSLYNRPVQSSYYCRLTTLSRAFAPSRVPRGKLVLSRLSAIQLTYMKEVNSKTCCPSPGLRSLRLHPGARPRGGARWRVPGGRTFLHGVRPGSAQMSAMGFLSHGLTTCRRSHGLWRAAPRPVKLAYGS